MDCNVEETLFNKICSAHVSSDISSTFQMGRILNLQSKKVDFDEIVSDIVTILVPGGRLVMKLEIKKSNIWLQMKCFER